MLSTYTMMTTDINNKTISQEVAANQQRVFKVCTVRQVDIHTGAAATQGQPHTHHIAAVIWPIILPDNYPAAKTQLLWMAGTVTGVEQHKLHVTAAVFLD